MCPSSRAPPPRVDPSAPPHVDPRQLFARSPSPSRVVRVSRPCSRSRARPVLILVSVTALTWSIGHCTGRGRTRLGAQCAIDEGRLIVYHCSVLIGLVRAPFANPTRLPKMEWPIKLRPFLASGKLCCGRQTRQTRHSRQTARGRVDAQAGEHDGCRRRP